MISKIEILKQWTDSDSVVHQILYRAIPDSAESGSLLEAAANDNVEILRNIARKQADKLLNPKIEKRGRLDILQDLTEQGAGWGLETDSEANAVKWFHVVIDGCHEKTFNNIRNAIDWIIEQICKKGI